MIGGNNLDSLHLIELANFKMPFGKHKGKYLINLPESYYIWFRQKGYPEGKLGRFMEEIYEIKMNGLDEVVRSLIQN